MLKPVQFTKLKGKPGMKRWIQARGGLFLLLLIAFALRVWRLDVQDIWWDEARNIDVALRPLAAIPLAPELDIHPPGYFILLHLWMRAAGHTAFATRFFSVWFGVLLIPLIVALLRRIGRPRAGAGAALYAALAPFLIGEAQETRMYTLTFALLTLTAIVLWDTLRERTGEKGATPPGWVYLGLLTAASVLVHYSAVFVLIAIYLYGLVYRMWDGYRREGGTPPPAAIVRSPLLRAGVLSLLLFLPQAPRAYQQIAPYGNPNLVVPTFAAYVGQLWRAYTVGIPAEGPWVSYALVGLGGILLLGLVYEIGMGRHRAATAYLLTAVLLPLLLYYAVLVRRATFAPRYISFVLPFLAGLWGIALAGWWRIRREIGGGMVLAFAAVLALGIHAGQFNPAYFREDTSGLARWLVAHTTADDLILIDVPYPLGFYYPRFSKDPDVPPPARPSHIAPAYYLFVDIHHVDERLNRLAAGKKRIFWVQWYKSDTDPRGVVTFLLRKYGVHAGRTAFRGYTVDWYRVDPNAHYRVAEGLRPLRVHFGDEVATVALAAAQAPPLPPAILRASDEEPGPRPVWGVVDWQRIGEAHKAYKVSARLQDPLGHLVAQDDRRLLDDRHLAFPYWERGERARNVYLLPLPVGTPPGTYTLTLRVYDPDTLEPLPARDAEGHPLGPDAAVARVRLRKAALFPPLTPTALTDAPIALVTYRLAAKEVAAGTPLPLSLLWVKEWAGDGEPLRVQLLLLDERGKAYSVDERPPVPWYPTDRWDVGEVVRSEIPWRLSPDTPNGRYTVHLRLVDRFGRVLDETDLGRVTVKGRPHRFQVPPLAHPLSPPPRFDDIALLLGYDMEGKIAPRGRVSLLLTWKVLTSPRAQYKTSVQILDARNHVLAQEDHVPLRGEAPTSTWLAGEILQDRFDLTLPDALPPGPKRVIVVMYDAQTLRRVPVHTGRGSPADYAILTTVEAP